MIKSIRWNLSERSRHIMGWRWCEEADIKLLREIMERAEASKPKNIWDAIIAAKEGRRV